MCLFPMEMKVELVYIQCRLWKRVLMPRFHSILCMLIIPRDPDAHTSITVIERLLVGVHSASRISNRTWFHGEGLECGNYRRWGQEWCLQKWRQSLGLKVVALSGWPAAESNQSQLPLFIMKSYPESTQNAHIFVCFHILDTLFS